LELPEELLESPLQITNPIHRKKIIAHVKLLGASIESQLRSTPRGRRGQTPRSPSNWSAGPSAGMQGRNALVLTTDDQFGGSDEDILSSAGAASLQRVASGASSNVGTGGLPGCSSAASSNRASGSMARHKELSRVSSDFSRPGSAMADRAAARRGRSMDRLAMLQQRSQGNVTLSTSRRPVIGGSRNTSPTGTAGSLRSVGNMSRQSVQSGSSRRQGSRGPPDGKAMSASGKRIDAWGELSPSTSRKGSFGKMPAGGEVTRDYGGALASPLAARRDCEPNSSYYYKATFNAPVIGKSSPRVGTAVIGRAPRRTPEQLGPAKSSSPGPAYRPAPPDWRNVRVGGAIGAAQRFAYHRPNSNHWLNESSDDY
jgi:hypothetical protein